MKRMETGCMHREHISVEEDPRARSFVAPLNLLVELADYIFDLVVE